MKILQDPDQIWEWMGTLGTDRVAFDFKIHNPCLLVLVEQTKNYSFNSIWTIMLSSAL